MHAIQREHVRLLQVVVSIADAVVDPQPGEPITEIGLRTLRESIEQARAVPFSDRMRVIDEEVVLLMRVLQATLAARRKRDPRADRWAYLARAFLAFIRTDLAHWQSGGSARHA